MCVCVYVCSRFCVPSRTSTPVYWKCLSKPVCNSPASRRRNGGHLVTSSLIEEQLKIGNLTVSSFSRGVRSGYTSQKRIVVWRLYQYYAHSCSTFIPSDAHYSALG